MVSVQVAASQTINSHMWIVATLLMSTGLEDTSKGRLIFQRLFSWGKISSSLDLGTEYKHNFLNNKTQRYASVQSLSRVRLFATPWTKARQASLFITNSRSLLKLMSMESVMPSKHPILCRPLLLPPSIFPSIRVISSESALCIRWPKYWSANEHPGLISF